MICRQNSISVNNNNTFMSSQVIKHELDFYCEADHTCIPRDQLLEHLSQNHKHKISKKPRIRSHEEVESNLLKRIHEITKIKIEIQISSNNLIKTILQITSNTMMKLDFLIKLYKDMILNNIFDNELDKKEIVNTYKVDPSLNELITDHFSQQVVGERISLDGRKLKAKRLVKELHKKYTTLFYCMIVSSDENFFVTGEIDGFLKVWDLKKVSLAYLFCKHKDRITSLALGLDNCTMLSGSHDCTVRLWDLKSRKHVFKFVGHENWVTSVLIAQDNRKGFSGSVDKSLKVWDLKKHEKLFSLYHTDQIRSICLIHQDDVLVTASCRIVRFCSPKSKIYDEIITGRSEVIWSMKFYGSENFFILGYSEGTVQIWQKNNLKLIFESKKHTMPVNTIDVLPDYKKFVTASTDRSIIIWDLDKLSIIRAISYKRPVLGAYFMGSCNSLILCFDIQIGLMNLNTFLSKIIVSPKVINMNTITLSNTLKYLAYATTKIKLIDLDENKKISIRLFIENGIGALAFNHQLTFLVYGDYSGNVTILSLPCLIMIKKFNTAIQPIQYLTISMNGKFIAASDCKSTLVVYNTQFSKVVFSQFGVLITSAIYCSNDEVFVYSDSSRIFILDKNYKYVNFMEFDHNVDKLMRSEHDPNLLIVFSYNKRFQVNLLIFKAVCQDKDAKDAKKWIFDMKESKGSALMNIPNIKIS